MSRQADQSLVVKLVLIPIFMFGFGFLLVPLYDVFCDITGLNGKVFKSDTLALDAEAQVNSPARTIQFLASSDHNSVWGFAPHQAVMQIKLGERYQTFFNLTNPTEQTVSFHSVPSVSPGLATDYLVKTECFCFEKQILKPGQSVKMPVVFQLRADTPNDYKKITLAYRHYSQPSDLNAAERNGGNYVQKL